MNFADLVMKEKHFLDSLEKLKEHIMTCSNINCKSILIVSFILQLFRSKELEVKWTDCEEGNTLNLEISEIVLSIMEHHKED